MQSGPKPKPTKLKLLHGNPGGRPLNKGEPKPAAVIPKCPRHLDREAKKEWRRISKELDTLGLLTQLDRAALAAYCQCWSRWVYAEQKLVLFGAVMKSPSGYPITSPYLAVANRALDQMHRFLSEFGMTPSSRSRVSVSEHERKSPLARLQRDYGDP